MKTKKTLFLQSLASWYQDTRTTSKQLRGNTLGAYCLLWSDLFFFWLPLLLRWHLVRPRHSCQVAFTHGSLSQAIADKPQTRHSPSLLSAPPLLPPPPFPTPSLPPLLLSSESKLKLSSDRQARRLGLAAQTHTHTHTHSLSLSLSLSLTQAAQLVAAALVELRDRKKPRLSWGQGEKERETESRLLCPGKMAEERWAPCKNSSGHTRVHTDTHWEAVWAPETVKSMTPQRKKPRPISCSLGEWGDKSGWTQGWGFCWNV